ncbi:MAG: hypothetical protein M1840_002033 [Geoglossum simile]|nr:MAG: hypothetical protein M1840_002033 [Geoglossum simile]
MGQELKQRVEYLINDLKAYQDYDYGKKGLCHAVKHDLYMWKKQQKDIVVVQVPQLYRDLWKQADCKTKDQQTQKALEEDWKAFPTSSSDGNHLRIEHKHGQLLIYCLPISPQYTSVNQFLPEGLKTVCGVWYACGIMRDMMAKGMPHKDPSDYHCGFNVSTAWGDYTTARMVFWELGITVEVQKGEAIFFLPRIMTHNAVEVQGGVRNVVDAFVHENVLIWKDRQQEEVTGEYRGHKKKRRKLGLEELRTRNSGESSSGGIGKAPEGTQNGGDSGTEGEMEALYHKNAQEKLGEEKNED